MHDTDRVSWILALALESGRRRIYTADGGIICQDGCYWHAQCADRRARLLGGSDRSRDYWRVMLFDLCSCEREEQTNKCKHRSSILLSAGVWYRHDPFSTLLLKPSVGLSGAFCLRGHVCCYLPVMLVQLIFKELLAV